MRQRIIHGAFVDMLTPDEFYKAIQRPVVESRIRAPFSINLDANGAGDGIAYKVPTGGEFALRRVTFELTNITEANFQANSINLNAAGLFVRYFKGDAPLQWGIPASSLGVGRIPGYESWGDEQGSYLRNGEVFRIKVGLGAAGAANSTLSGTVEGILITDRPNA